MINSVKAISLDCPHCSCQFMVMENEIACAIFRHAIYKNTFEQINPHMPKEECDTLFEEGKVYGCAKPFRLEKNEEGEYIAVVCDYI